MFFRTQNNRCVGREVVSNAFGCGPEASLSATLMDDAPHLLRGWEGSVKMVGFYLRLSFAGAFYFFVFCFRSCLVTSLTGDLPTVRYYKITGSGRFPYAAFVLPITYITDKLVAISGKPYRLYLTDKLLKGNPFKPKTGCGPNRTPPLYYR